MWTYYSERMDRKVVSEEHERRVRLNVARLAVGEEANINDITV